MRVDVCREELAIGPRNSTFWSFQIESKSSHYRTWVDHTEVSKELITLCRLCYNLDIGEIKQLGNILNFIIRE